MSRFWIVGPIAWDSVLWVPDLPGSGGFVQATRMQERPGGTGANVAVALASVASHVNMVGHVGNDNFGVAMLDHLGQHRVGTAYVHHLAEPTSRALVFVEPSGQRTIVGTERTLLDRVPMPFDQVESGDVVFFVSAQAQLIPTFAAFRGLGALVATCPVPGDWDTLPVDHVIGSEEQFRDGGGVQKYIKRMQDGEVTSVIETLGSAGAIAYYEKGRVLYQEARRVDAIDATGAGDAFAAGFLYMFTATSSIARAIAMAVEWGTRTVMKEGSIPPPWDDKGK